MNGFATRSCIHTSKAISWKCTGGERVLKSGKRNAVIRVIQHLSGYFAFLAIFISCLGLLVLLFFTAEQRTREVGIRKVLGASVSQIVTMLSKDFVILIIASTLVSTPLAYLIMNEWLHGFEYHVGMEWWMFAVASACAVGIALFTVSFQAIKTALSNPVESLKSE